MAIEESPQSENSNSVSESTLGTAMPKHTTKYIPEMELDDGIILSDDEEHIEDTETTTYFVDTPDGRLYYPKCPDENKPKIGQTFDSYIDAYNFYKNYGSISGFDVRKSTSYTNKKGVKKKKYLVCHRHGKNDSTSPFLDTLTGSKSKQRVRKVLRCKCKAMLCIKYIDDTKLSVHSFVEAHNHDMASRIGKQLLRSYRNLTLSQQDFVMDLGNQNVGPTKAFNIMKELSGGYESVGATVTDIRNFKRDLKTYISHRDAQMIVNNLEKMQQECPTFSFYHSVDDEGTLDKLFWSDRTSVMDCKLFADVVSFDATYRTNKYNMVFVPFTGVDNHKKSITLAAGLLFHEDITSYTWLLQCFKRNLQNDPLVLVTDQDPAIKVSVSNVFPNSKHRYCMWHITEKIKAKVGINITKNTDFMKDISSAIWSHHVDISDFEEQWNCVVAKYELQNNKWLAHIYAIRESWIPVYIRKHPMGSLIRSTSRSESSNSFFGRYLNADLTLVEFYMGFTTAIQSQRNIRVQLNDNSVNGNPTLKTDLRIEKHAAEQFTLAVFSDIQEEIWASCIRCSNEMTIEHENCKIYTISDIDYETTKFKVTFTPSTNHADCCCQMFPSTGIICRHIFHVLRSLDFSEIPSSMIAKRWTKFTENKHIDVGTRNGRHISQEASTLVSQIGLLMRSVMASTENDVEKLQRLLDFLKRANAECSLEIHQVDVNNKESYFEQVLGIPKPSEVNIKAPVVARNKGCGKRMKSTREIKSTKAKKRKRTCKTCHQRGYHDSRNCPTKAGQNTSSVNASSVNNSDSPTEDEFSDESESE